MVVRPLIVVAFIPKADDGQAIRAIPRHVSVPFAESIQRLCAISRELL